MSTLTKKQIDQLSASELKDLARSGIVRIMTNEAIQPGKLKKEDRPEYKKFLRLKGKPIHINAAARKYKIGTATLTRWAQNPKLIRTIRFEKNRRMLDQADVAYCVEVWKNRAGRGRWIFDPNGLPYIPITR